MLESIFSCAILENRILNGYGWMNFNRNTNELSVVAKKIFEYKFKREALEIYNGANTKENLSYAEWEKRCKDLLGTFFSRDSTSSGIILFPDTAIILYSQICQVNIWQSVMSTLNAWCKVSSTKEATGLIIRNYDLKNHLYFTGITKYEVKDILAFKDFRNMFNFQESDQRCLVFNPSLKIILIIRLVELLEGELHLVKKEIDYCIDEVNLLCFLLKDELTDTGVIVTGFVAYSGENTHSQSACKDCSSMVFTCKIFNSVETFQRFWESLVKKKRIEDLAIRLAASEKKGKANIFQAVASTILGYLAHLQFVKLEEPILPVTEHNPTGNIKQAELLLNRYQMEIAYSGDKRIWLEGNYGTGKTVVALKKLELLLQSLKDKEVIYYVSFATKSCLDVMVKQRFKKNQNVRVIKGAFSLSNIVNHQILPKERELGTKNIHLIVDEYSSQYLSTKEIRNLGQIFTKEEKFIKSTILIAVQPIEINRVDNFYARGVKSQFSRKKHEVSELIQILEMKVRILKNVMRTTVQINTLAEITQEYLNNRSNRYVRQKQHHSISYDLHKIDESKFQKTFSSLPPEACSESSSSFIVSSGSSSQIQELTYHDGDRAKSNEINSDVLSQRTNPKLPKLKGRFKRFFSRLTRNSSSPIQFEKIIDYDELYKLMSTDIRPDKENYQETVTTYCYTRDSKIGHGIKGPLPQLIKLHESADHCQQIALIASVLDTIIISAETKSKRIAAIHFEPDDPPSWLKILFQLTNSFSNLAMTTDTKEFLKNTSENLVLVKNLNFVRGLEFSDVLLVLDSNEHHLRHLIPEAIARCGSNLSILIRPSLHGSNSPDTIADLAGEWERCNWDNHVLSILQIGFCGKPSCNNLLNHRMAYCVDETGTSYGIHKNCKLYRNFLKEIQLTNVKNVQPEHNKQPKEVAAV